MLPLPTAPTGSNVTACEGGSIPDLLAIGAQVTWYSDAGLTNQVGLEIIIQQGKLYQEHTLIMPQKH